MLWQLSNKFDTQARLLADRHYSRRSPGTSQFCPPGRTLVLYTFGALWVTSWMYPEYDDDVWAGMWNCALFRREDHCRELSSVLIRDAIAATRWYWRYGNNPTWDVPEPAVYVQSLDVLASFVTFIDPSKIKKKRDPGRCFLRAGFVYDTKRTDIHGLLALVLPVTNNPEPAEPLPRGAMNAATREWLHDYKTTAVSGDA